MKYFGVLKTKERFCFYRITKGRISSPHPMEITSLATSLVAKPSSTLLVPTKMISIPIAPPSASGFRIGPKKVSFGRGRSRRAAVILSAEGGSNSNSSTGGGTTGSNKVGGSSSSSSSVSSSSNYVVPLDYKAPAGLTRPLAEILRDLNKRVSDKIINPDNNSTPIPWYHANRMLSFYAPGWCGEIRDVIFRDNGSVTVLYRVTIRGSDGEAHRESTGSVALNDGQYEDPVAAAEEIAFCRACARFGFGLYLYHEDETL